MARLQGQVAIVTGAGRGIGRAIVEALAAEGAAVGLAARSERELAEAASRLPRAVAVPTDVTRRADVERLVAVVERELGAPTLLTWDHVGPAWEGDPEAWWRDVEVTLRGTFLCTREVLPGMIAGGSGRIVAVSSYAANDPRPYSSGYASGKAALLRFVDSVAAEVADHGVYVFSVSPGFVRTRLVDEIAQSTAGRRWLPELAERQDALEPERVGRLVVELASGRADALSGRFLHVLDDLDDLIARAEQISRDDRYALRFQV